jgi:nucleoid-associated protein YgaU
MSNRYNPKTPFLNKSEYYKFLLEKRGIKAVQQYGTPRIYNPTPSERASIPTTQHIWRYGDRYYTLAHTFYGDVRFWWVIAWYNGYPTEAQVATGDVLTIPLNIEDALRVLRAY